MKKSKVLFLALAFVFVSTANIFASNPSTNPNEVRQEILKLVSDIDLSQMEADTEKVKLQFIVNNRSEVIVLNVTESELESSIKSKLNYHKIDAEGVVKNKIYTVPVTFNKK